MLIMICRNAYWYCKYFGTWQHTSCMHWPKYTEQGDLKDCKAGHMRRWDTEYSGCFVLGLYLYKFIFFTVEPHNRRGISSRLNGQALKLAPSQIKEIWQHLWHFPWIGDGASPSILRTLNVILFWGTEDWHGWYENARKPWPHGPTKKEKFLRMEPFFDLNRPKVVPLRR